MENNAVSEEPEQVIQLTTDHWQLLLNWPLPPAF
jgi:hypothetical protein